jgi:DNA gyrase subunit A
LAAGARAIYFGTVTSSDDVHVVTAANSSDALAGTDAGSVKVSALTEFPAKGRATGGVRAHKFVRNEDQLYFAAVVQGEPLALAADGKPVELPELAKRDASGTPLASVVGSVGSR